jgi:hypothetical protein
MRSGQRAVVAVAVVLAAGALGALASGHTAARSADAAANEATARSDAAALLASLSLPPGATTSPLEPVGDGGVLARPGSGPPTTPDVVDDSAWWLVPGGPQAVLAFIEAHPPPGSRRTGSGMGSRPHQPTVVSDVFDLPAITNVLSTRELVVEVVRLPDGSTGLRADAQVVWITPRDASESIPAGTRRLWVTVTRSHVRPLLATSRMRIARVVALLNGLPRFQPGLYACPADFGIRVRLAFYPRRGAPPLAVAVVNPGGCGDVRLSIGGVSQPALTSMGFAGSGRSPRASLVRQIETALGLERDALPG